MMLRFFCSRIVEEESVEKELVEIFLVFKSYRKIALLQFPSYSGEKANRATFVSGQWKCRYENRFLQNGIKSSSKAL